jgi:hypothetical protein
MISSDLPHDIGPVIKVSPPVRSSGMLVEDVLIIGEPNRAMPNEIEDTTQSPIREIFLIIQHPTGKKLINYLFYGAPSDMVCQ